MPVDHLVTFKQPPVTEVALGVQFSESVVDLEVLAAYSAQLSRDFPKRQQLEPLAPAREVFGAEPSAPTFTIELVPAYVMPRTWFLSEDERHLVQLQGDRLIVNWRKRDPSDTYPRYARLRPNFEERLSELRGCLADARRADPAVSLVEVTYVNELAWPDVRPGDVHPPLSRVLRAFRDEGGTGFLPRPEDAMLQSRFRISDPETGTDPAGRLHTALQPAFRAEDLTPIYILKMTAHLVMQMSDDAGIVRALDLGREWVVRGFDEVTSTELHGIWGRTEGVSR